MSRRDVLTLSAAALALTACGFHPVYGPGGGVAQRDLGAIEVALIPERAGLLLREALQQRFDRGDALAKRYRLEVSLGVIGDAISVQRDSSVTRIREIATARWSLRSLDPAQTLVTSGLARALDGINVIDNQYFASDLASEAATQRIVHTVADQIALQLAAYFNKQSRQTG